MTIIVVSRDHAERGRVERFIGKVYAHHYGAEITSFPDHLVALMDRNGAIECASGLRFAETGFFSECYLDQPIEDVLAPIAGGIVARDSVFEVTSLASTAPHSSTRFLRRIVAYGEFAGFSWAFFTATERLRALLQRVELPVATLAPAVRHRVADPAAWGSYYESNPHVCAVDRAAAAAFLAQRREPVVHV